jgi:subtilisin-like proprotein convertase family protein
MKMSACLGLACFAGLALSAAAQAQVVVVAGSGSMVPGVDTIANLLPESQDDDAAVGVTIPAAYGNVVLPAGLYYADTNGRLTTDGGSVYVNAPLTAASPAGYYPLWDDLYTADYSTSGIYAVDTGSVFVIQWNFDPLSYAASGTPAAYPNDNARMQLQIFPAGHVPAAQFVYSGMGTIAGQSATIGAVTTGGAVAQYSYNTATVSDSVQLDIVTGASGACCLADGSCIASTASSCAAQGGVYRGNDTQCGSANCPQPAGQYTYTGGAVPIPDGTGTAGCGTTVFAEITVPASFSVTGATAGVNIAHTYQGDLQFRLVHGAVSVPLVMRPGVGYNGSTYGFFAENYGASATSLMRFTDAAGLRYQAPDVVDGIDNVTGDWKPDSGTMSQFAGANAQGVWRLEAEDCAGGDTGTIQAFRITLQGGATQVCYPNCDNSTAVPFLNVLDFNCFLNKFSAGDSYANCDGSTTVPVLNVLDFNCFLNRFSAGCSAP